MSTYPRYVPHTTGDGKWDDHDINAVVDHVKAGVTPEGIFAYPTTFTMREMDGICDAINAAGQQVYGGPEDKGGKDGADGGAVMNACRSAIVTAGKGGVIGFRNGVYPCLTAFTGGNGVDLIGESMGPFEDFTRGVVLNYTGGSSDAFLDYRTCRNFHLANIKLRNSGSAIRGLYCGDTTNSANKSKAITLRNVVIDSFDYGIQGDTFGPDDSNYDHVFLTNNSIIGCDNLSSMSRWFGGSIAGSPIGYRIRKAAGGGVADAGAMFYGTVFSGNDVHIDIAGAQSINILGFNDCWMEDTTTMLLDTGNATPGITVGSINFNNCVCAVNNATATNYFDLSGINCHLRFIGGTLYSDAAKPITTNGAGGTLQYLSIQPQAGTDKITMTDAGDGSRGFNQGIIPVIGGGTPFTPAAPVGGTYTSVWLSTTMNAPSIANYIVKAHACYRWNPGSASGKIRFYANGNGIGASEPGANGYRYDEVECTAAARAHLAGLGDMDIQVADDNATAPTIYDARLIYQY